MSTAAILFFALILDAVLGEPKWLWSRFPHPAVLIGKLIGEADTRLNKDAMRKIKGAVLVLCLVFGGWLIGSVLSHFGTVINVIIVAIFLAQKSLVEHVRAVADALRMSLGEGRRAVAMIVSRDTSKMDQSAVSRSAIESASENLSDGVIAPAFWFLIGGLPGLLIYKAVNTADSMIGYLTPKHADFGWAAARLDDVLNWVPARLTSVMIAAAYNGLSTIQEIREDAALHRSPNAGWPEAAMSRVLDVALAGPRSYDGELQEFPYVHETGRKDIGPNQIDEACQALWRVWAILLGVTGILALL